jgi:uncharacterized iron-regulated membrane protein
MTRKAQLRTALRFTHRWIALTLGLIFVVLSASGSLLLFQPQLFTWAHGDLVTPAPQRRGSVDEWVRQARAVLPGVPGPSIIWGPRVDHNLSNAAMLIFETHAPGGFGHSGLVGVLVAPATGAVLGTVDIDRSAAYALVFLHRDLWAGRSGRIVVGVTGIGALLLLLLGLYLWWPRTRILQKLSPRPWRLTLTRAGRLHDVTGAWSVILLIILAGSGVYLVQPGWVSPLFRALLGPGSQHVPPQMRCSGAIGFDQAIARASELVPNRAFLAAEVQDRRNFSSWKLVFSGEHSHATFQQSEVTADLGCGSVMVRSTPESRKPIDSIGMWLMSIHDGTALGVAGQILVAIAGLAPPLLLWSGMRAWMRKRGWIGAASNSDSAGVNQQGMGPNAT